MFKEKITKRRNEATAAVTVLNDKCKKYYPALGMLTIAVAFLFISGDAFADGDTNNVSSGFFENLYIKIKELVGGAAGKTIALVLGSSGIASGFKNGFTVVTCSLLGSAFLLAAAPGLIEGTFTIVKAISQ